MSADIVAITKEILMGNTSLADKMLALNNAHAQALSWLDRNRLSHLVAEAFFAGRVGGVDGLLIAFDQTADYDSPNFLWFRSRFSHFVYVDRVAVAPEVRGRGLAGSLYRKLFSKASQSYVLRRVFEGAAARNTVRGSSTGYIRGTPNLPRSSTA